MRFFEGARADAFLMPVRDQRIDVPWLEVHCTQRLETEVLKLVGNQVQNALAVGIGREAAFAIAVTQLL